MNSAFQISGFMLAASLFTSFSVGTATAALPLRQEAAQTKSSNTAAKAEVTAAGEWEVAVNTPDGAVTVKATLEQTGEGVTGSIVTPFGSSTVKVGAIMGNKISIVFPVSTGGDSFDANLTGSIDGDVMKGNVSTPMGVFEFTAKRKASAATLAGDWQLAVSTPNGDLPVTVSLKQDGETLTGTTKSQFGQAEITNGKGSGNTLSFAVKVTVGNDTFDAKYSGQVEGDEIKGKVDTPLGVFDFKGSRQKK